MMNDAALSELGRWTTEAGLAGKSETALLDGFCRRAVEAGLPIARAVVIIDTLHPVHEGRATRWRREGDGGQTELVEYGPTDEGEAAENWRRSPFFRLLESGGSELRIRIAAGAGEEFPTKTALQDEGMTDCLVLINRFAAHGVIGEMDCVYSYWATDAPHGFGDREIAALIGLMPGLALSVKCVSLARIAGTLVETYSAAMPAGGCSPAASGAVSPRRSGRSCGTAICADLPGSPIARRRMRSSRCSTIMPRR